MRLSSDWTSRLARGTFALVMLLAWAGAPQTAGASGAGERPAMDPQRAIELADASRQMADTYAAIDRDLPRDTFDPTAVAAAVGNDPDALFKWVRDNTSYVPYRGVLRGPVGVLMDRNGNSLDRSLLLARLIQIAGQKARLAHATLPEDRAQTLLKRVWEDPGSGLPADIGAAPPDDAAITAAAAKYKVDPAEARRARDRVQLRQEKLQESLVGTVSAQSEALAALLGPAAGSDDGRAARLAAVADHWWVQAMRGEKWVDLDPMTRDAAPGTVPAPPAATVELSADGSLPAELTSLCHEVELRVRIEGIDQSVAHTGVVFHQALRPAELAGNAVVLQIASLEWPQDLDLTNDPAGAMKSALAKQQNFIPILQINGKPMMQGSFDVHGQVNLKPNLDALSKTGGASGGAANRAGDVLDAGPPAVEQAKGELTAVWVDYEIRVPGQQPRVITRDLFDALGPAKRSAGGAAQVQFDDALRLRRAASIYRQIDILPSGCVPSKMYALHLAMQNVIANATVLQRPLRDGSAASLRRFVKSLGSVQRFPSALWAWAASRQLPVGAGAALAVDRPNIFTFHTGYALQPSGTLVAVEATDLVANEVAVRGLAGASAVRARLTQGVMETAREPQLLRAGSDSTNTASLFAASQGQGVKWVKISSPQAPELSGSSLTPDVQARIRADLQAGYAVIAPTAPVNVGGQLREGWWRIDPRDGSCIGFGAEGTGPELVEYAIVLGFILVEAGMAFRCLAETHGSGVCITCFCVSAIVDIVGLMFGLSPLATVAVGGGSFGIARLCEDFMGD